MADDKCANCNGTGRCPQCHGTGKFGYPGFGSPDDYKITCSFCQGSGCCQQCQGKGSR